MALDIMHTTQSTAHNTRAVLRGHSNAMGKAVFDGYKYTTTSSSTVIAMDAVGGGGEFQH